jgi:Haem-binding domain
MLLRILLWLLVASVVIQMVPFGHQHTNPPVVREPAWDSPQTRVLAKRACFDCHSNETTWPWYSSVAPVSWLTQRDVNGGRRHLNFSEWNRPQRHAGHAAEEIQKGDMPLWFYLPMHSAARLTDAEKAALVAGFQKMPGFEDSGDDDESPPAKH